MPLANEGQPRTQEAKSVALEAYTIGNRTRQDLLRLVKLHAMKLQPKYKKSRAIIGTNGLPEAGGVDARLDELGQDLSQSRRHPARDEASKVVNCLSYPDIPLHKESELVGA